MTRKGTILRHLNRICWSGATALGLLAFAACAQAQATYHVTTNTSSLSGQIGFLDFQFAKGNAFGSPDATATLSNVVTDGLLATTSDATGTASGILPGAAMVSNMGTSGFPNELNQGITFGQVFNFDITFTGTALNPAVSSNYGSTFAYSLFGSDDATPLLTTDPNGTLLDINLSKGANLSATTFPTTPGGRSVVTATTGAPVPEGSSAVSLGLLLILSAGGLTAVRLRRKIS